MANHHLRNKSLSLKAKGLLSLMLSLPEDWDYTTRGLSCICKDGVDSIRMGIQELESNGYLVRERRRNSNGQYGAIEYTILEKPQQTAIPPPAQGKPILENPIQAVPTQVLPVQENPAQLNIEELNTQKSNMDVSNIHSFFPASSPSERQTEIQDVRERIKHQIEYDWLREQFRQEQVDELLEIMVEVGKPWPYEEELRDKTARLIFLDAELNLDANKGSQPEQALSKSARPSVLDRLRSQSATVKKERTQKHREEVR